MTKQRSAEQTRTLTFERSASDAPGSPIPVVVSSDAVVEVLDGPEILIHTPDAIDLRRAPLPIIATHRGNQINVGVVEDLTTNGRQLRGMARFGSRDEAQGYERDVRAGIIRSVSAGYNRLRGKTRNDGVLVTDRWMPSHVAMIAEPADVNAGFFRGKETAPPFQIDDVEVAATAMRGAEHKPAAPAATKGNITMSETTAAAGDTNAANNPPTGADVERLRITAIRNLSKQNYGPYKPSDEDTDRWIQEGATPDIVSREILDQIATRAASTKSQPAEVGLSDAEVKQYSMTRAIRACVEKNWPKVAPFEAEVSRAIGQRLGKVGGEHNFFVPLEVQRAKGMQQRDMIVATSTLGGYMVGTQVTGFIDLLRHRSVVMRMGATVMPGLTGSVSVPKLTGASTAYWFASEAGTATESTPTFGQMTLIPKTVGGYIELSRQLLLQTQYNADAIANGDLARVIGLAVDLAAISGPGTAGQPTGIVNTSGLGTAAPTAGTAVNYADMIRFQTTVAGSDAMMPGFGYVTTPTVAGILMGKARFTNSDTPIWEGNIMDGRVVGAPAMTS